FTRLGALSGATASPWRSFAFEPFTVGAGWPVPPFPATAAPLSSARAVRQATNAPANRRRAIRNGFDAIARFPLPTGLAVGLARRDRAWSAGPRGRGPFAPGNWSGSPAPPGRSGRTRHNQRGRVAGSPDRARLQASAATLAARSTSLPAMEDLGPPGSYLTLSRGLEVYSSDGRGIGRVEEVVAEPGADVFEGFVIEAGVLGGHRFVDATLV